MSIGMKTGNSSERELVCPKCNNKFMSDATLRARCTKCDTRFSPIKFIQNITNPSDGQVKSPSTPKPEAVVKPDPTPSTKSTKKPNIKVSYTKVEKPPTPIKTEIPSTAVSAPSQPTQRQDAESALAKAGGLTALLKMPLTLGPLIWRHIPKEEFIITDDEEEDLKQWGITTADYLARKNIPVPDELDLLIILITPMTMYIPRIMKWDGMEKEAIKKLKAEKLAQTTAPSDLVKPATINTGQVNMTEERSKADDLALGDIITKRLKGI